MPVYTLYWKSKKILTKLFLFFLTKLFLTSRFPQNIPGGDGYKMINDEKLNQRQGFLDFDQILAYLKKFSPVTSSLQVETRGFHFFRIKFRIFFRNSCRKQIKIRKI